MDTSEGKALIADSLKSTTTQSKNANEVKSKPEVKIAPEKPKVEKSKLVEEINEESEEEESETEEEESEEEKEEEETANVPDEGKNTEVKRGK